MSEKRFKLTVSKMEFLVSSKAASLHLSEEAVQLMQLFLPLIPIWNPSLTPCIHTLCQSYLLFL